jgi:ABC-type polysaccharide/polyol phosphate transport system ATPase subunit
LDTAIEVNNVSLTYRLYKKRNLKHSIIKRDLVNKNVLFNALNNISFSVKKGEVFGIIGPNGCGKSTLLRVIAGILKPDSGSVVVNGHVSPLLGLGSGFNIELDGIDNIYLNGLLLGFKKADLDKKMESIVGFAELGEFISQPVKTYSSGMKARLGFAIAAHLEPDILLIDEVLGVGDINFQKKSSAKIKEIINGNSTVILVSHNQAVLKELSSEVMWMNKGTAVMIGEPEAVLAEYTKANR